MRLHYINLMDKANDSRCAGVWSHWRWQLRHRLTDPDIVGTLMAVSQQDREAWRAVSVSYPISITPYYFSLIAPDDPNDPIRRQCIPEVREITPTSGSDDPLDEEGHMPVPGLVRRYRDRCLILATHMCAVYCRHCNRKRWWRRSTFHPTESYFSPMVEYIGRERGIREVILSGGDPFVLPDRVLAWLLERIRAIDHVEVVRVGTRVPVVMPMRITSRLCCLLRKYRPIWVNTQFNHPREITPASADACDRLVSAGIPVSNQSVLLKGINDNVPTMQALLTGLQRISVRPYYLFQCDPVWGTEHFWVDIPVGQEMMRQLWAATSGLCLPRYVADLPHSPGKCPLDGSFDKYGEIG